MKARLASLRANWFELLCGAGFVVIAGYEIGAAAYVCIVVVYR